MNDPQLPNRYPWLGKTAIFAVALIIAVAVIIRGNFLEGLLKLLGAGASTTEYEDQAPEDGLPIQIAQIEFKYNYLTAPSVGAVRINTAFDGRLVIEKKDLDLEAMETLVLTDVELNQGEQYVAVLEGEDVDSKIIYFVATERGTDDYFFTFGRFYESFEQSLEGDFNGDGVVDSLDFAVFLKRFQSYNEEAAL